MFFGLNASGILSTPSQIKEISTLANSGAMAPELASVLISLICDGVDKIPEAFRPKNIR